MALDLAEDGGRGVRGELEAALGVEAVDGLYEADGAHLDKVVEGLSPVLELAREEANEVEVAHDELVARGLVTRTVLGKEVARACLVPRQAALGRRGCLLELGLGGMARRGTGARGGVLVASAGTLMRSCAALRGSLLSGARGHSVSLQGSVGQNTGCDGTLLVGVYAITGHR